MSALSTVIEVLRPLGRPTVGRLPANITSITFAVAVGQVERSPGLPQKCRDWTIDVLVLSPLADPEHADLQLEDALDDVLDAIDAAQTLRWNACERVVLEEDYNAIRVAVVVTMQPPPPATTTTPSRE